MSTFNGIFIISLFFLLEFRCEFLNFCFFLKIFFPVKIKWNKETYDLELDTNESPSVFKAQIFALTGVSTDRQKVMFKGSVIKEDEWNSTMLKSIKNVSKFCHFF